ncbi:hypothetical protein DFJ63DRAFT_320345 [Scheffersomyces coipomensis]|uniref:uncharacterized protein n=1 Tax=Scheffersomyces coipomensis TaxID=1788519 RepID=UPI00315C94DD
MSDPNTNINTRTSSLPPPHTNKPPPPEGQISQSTSTTSSLARTLDSSQTNQTELTSPSKSFRNFFKSRLSTYSIESISEEPAESRKSIASSSTNQDIVSPSKISNLLLRPKFSRSKSSSNSIQQSLQQAAGGSIQAPPSTSSFVQLNNSSNGSLTKEKEVTIDDFADTESSNDDSGDAINKSYDEESVNSLLMEYQRPKTFVYKELLDEDDHQSPSTSKSVATESKSSPDNTNGLNSGDQTIISHYDENVSIGRVERAIRVSSPPVVRQSPVPELKDPSIRNSRGSDLISTTMSDSDHSQTKYPDPNLSNVATPMQTPTIRHMLNNPRHSGGDDSLNSASRRLGEVITGGEIKSGDIMYNENETALKLQDNSVRNSLNTNETMLKRETFRSSMSSGELLNKLQGFETGNDKPQASSTLRYSHLDEDDLEDLKDRKFGNLTAGLDSTNELPFMLYKVQDKDYDESNQRWSVYETNRASQIKQEQEQEQLKNTSPQVIQSKALPPDFEPPSFPEHEDLRQGSISSSGSNYDRYEEANEFFNSNQSHPSFPAPPHHIGIIPTQSSSSSSNQVYHTASGRDTTDTSSNLYHTVTEGTISSAAGSVSTFQQVVPDENTEPIIPIPPQVHAHEFQSNVTTPIVNQFPSRTSPASSHYREITPPILHPEPVAHIDSPHRNITPPYITDEPQIHPQTQPSTSNVYNQQDREPETLVLSKPPPDLIIPNPSEYDGRRGISSHGGQIDEDEYYIQDIEKQIMHDNENVNHGRSAGGYVINENNHYSWTRFGTIMLIGLIIPPVYFLLSLGVFDSSNNYQQYYSGLHYYNNRQVLASSTNKDPNSINQFSRSQKMISFGIGITWTVVILAMIGVGLGVGLTS